MPRSPEHRPRRPRRWDLVLTWAVLLAPALVLAGVLVARQQTGDLEARLVRDARELLSRRHPRPVHVDAPSPGAIGDAIPAHLPSLDAAAQELAKDEPALRRTREVVAGSAPLDTLPPWTAAALQRLGPDLDALLAATRAERADFPATRDCQSLLDDGGWAGWQLAATLAGVRMRTSLAAGEPEAALRDGLDGLALGRDLAVARFLVGRMEGAEVVARLAPPMVDAIDALPGAAERRDAARRVRIVRDALPPLSRTFRDAATVSSVYMSAVLPATVLDALGPCASAVRHGGATRAALWQRLMFRDGWRGLREAQDALTAAADLPEPVRSDAFEDIARRALRQVNPLAAIAAPGHGKYARRSDAARLRLDALVLAAGAGAFRDERRRWPSSVAELAEAGELTTDEAGRLAGARLERVDDRRALSIAVPLPHADVAQPDETLAIVLRGAAR
ncbi:hypothetical protein Adeh_2917 [Anaeromyxobacter dehalogenans 2CP-C]|uniref:Uncharacterized protein n=1 Tax=Anaeromyxobacter dehalogenans (strain 2CP-C) TaxID=290397 RepID=Q2IDN2_ANADE|nr:hypothetical protein Adeh_2917 [Anaeromyxobacter dehalogenans 2CP-C]